MIRKLIYKMRKRRFCKLNRWFCPDCIYHDFVFEGAIFRGNKCRYPKYREKERRMNIDDNTIAEAINDIAKWRAWSHTYDNTCMDGERSEPQTEERLKRLQACKDCEHTDMCEWCYTRWSKDEPQTERSEE